MRISEVSPNTVEGSFSKDLIISKLWLIRELKKIQPTFVTIYILGSWYGNLSLLMIDDNLGFDRIINIDTDESVLRQSDDMAEKLGISDRITSMCKDANLLDYRHLGGNGLVINTSCNNIKGNDWFNNIPKGTMVALQGRDTDPGSPNIFDDIDSFVKAYPLGKMLFSGKLRLKDPETNYRRFMVIGMR